MLISNRFTGYCLLIFTALLWGTAFSFQKHAGEFVDAFTFNFLRFGMAIPALALLFLLPTQLFAGQAPSATSKHYHHNPWFIGGVAGIFMFLGISLQQVGLAYTTTGKSGFLTSLYIILVPILGLFLRQRCQLEVWLGALLTLLGIFLLGGSNSGSAENDFNLGDILTILCAFAWAAQVMWLGFFAYHANVLKIAIVQVLVVSAMSGVVMLFNTGLPSSDIIWAIRYDILYTGVVSAGIAFTLQILGQRMVAPTEAALIMSSEAVFAMLVGILFLGETISSVGLVGCVFILVGIVLAQLQGKVFFRHQRLS